MLRLNVTINVNRNPARRVYVEHLVFGIPGSVYITDNEGRIRDNTNNLGIDSWTGNVDIRILGQNTVARQISSFTWSLMAGMGRQAHQRWDRRRPQYFCRE